MRHRGRFCYVAALLAGHREPAPILRLRYQGLADRWAIGIYLASAGHYTESELPASFGPKTGTPEQGVDDTFILYAGPKTGHLPPGDHMTAIGERYLPAPVSSSQYQTTAGEGGLMDERDVLAERFEAERGRLRAVAYRMLGSLAEAEDAVQEAWLRLARSDQSAIENFSGWLTTVVGRVCLDMLRACTARREDALDVRLPDPVVTYGDESDPEAEALLADSVGLALLVVLETLTPAERLAFVLHDMFAVPFDEIARMLGRSPDATKMMASRARRRVRGAVPAQDADTARQRAVVDAFLAAARGGDFEALVAVLDPDVVLRADTAAGPVLAVGARDVAGRASMFARLAAHVRPVLVNGVPGVLAATADGAPMAVMAFTVVAGRIAEIDSIADSGRLAALNLRFED